MTFVLPKNLLLGVTFAAVLAGCTTTDVAPVLSEPTVLTLSQLKVVEETAVDGDLKLTRFASDSEGRFAIGVAPLDGAERNRAFAVAERNYPRLCGGQIAGVGTVGKTGTRAPYYNVEKRTHYIYMQCTNSNVAG